MATPHVRYQLHLHGPQIGGSNWQRGFLLLLALLLAGPALAQRKRSDAIDRTRKGHIKGITVENLSNYNQKFFRPGIYVAPNFSRFFIEQSAAYIQAARYGQGIAANAIISPGFAVGFIGDIRLGNPSTPFHLRFAPGLNFLTRRVEFTAQGAGGADTIRTQEVGTTQLELPLLLKYQSNRRRNTRFYMVGGIKPSIAVTQRQNTPAINQLTVARNDLMLEYGVGLDLFYPYFKFGPEVRFSHGLTNILQPRDNRYSNSLQSLRTNTVTLYLNIE
ncbi:outer membrane beta-barrel protein [Hymenobacter sp. HMF4947]|uniref:Outer membrane beta-barrel protein n=1 Tax=Hymenobacter ginkgonis TaxID=2682976 RepID=A0A7K1TAT9_9BACT|nr:porin family protein [Hymenobacter ginkgonis]MVN75514.1 outer membrane beta-barrel protein [Hymenobacter ginkgonis]